jgi:hypothetical protein
MLAGLGGALVPLVVHLLNRSRARTVRWGAMMFLPGGRGNRVTSDRLKEWSLLAVRMGLVAALAMALARPVASATWTGAPTGPATLVVVLDRSASMGMIENGHARWETARSSALQALGALRKGDRAALVLIGDGGGSQRFAEPTTDIGAVSAYVSGLDASFGVADIGFGLARAADILDRSDTGWGDILLVSDRQALSWRSIDKLYLARWEKRWRPTGRGSAATEPAIQFVPIGSDDAENVAIDSIAVLNPPVVRNLPVDIEVGVHNYGLSARASLPVEILTDARTAARETVTVEAHGTARVRATVRFTTAGPHLVTAQTTASGMASDDQLDYAVEAIDPLPVLIVSGDAEGGPFRTQADYIRMALAPFRSSGRPGSDLANVTVVRSSTAWSDFGSTPLTAGGSTALSASAAPRYRVIVLADVPSVTAAEARALEQQVYGGCGLVVAPGPLCDVGNYDQFLEREGEGLLPGRLGKLREEGSEIVTTNADDPAFGFLAGQSGGWPGVNVGRHFELVARTAGDARTGAALADGGAFEVDGSFGRGRVEVLAAPLDANWGTLALANDFVPFVQSSLRMLASASEASRNLAIGQPFAMTVDGPVEPPLRVRLPDDSDRSLSVSSTADGTEVRFDQTNQPGLYRVNLGPTRRTTFVVRGSAEESDLTPLEPADLQSLADRLGMTVIDRDKGTVADVLSAGRGTGEMWGPLLGLTLALAMAEMGLSRWWSKTVRMDNG